jgi:hypothetical protein
VVDSSHGGNGTVFKQTYDLVDAAHSQPYSPCCLPIFLLLYSSRSLSYLSAPPPNAALARTVAFVPMTVCVALVLSVLPTAVLESGNPANRFHISDYTKRTCSNAFGCSCNGGCRTAGAKIRRLSENSLVYVEVLFVSSKRSYNSLFRIVPDPIQNQGR